MRPASLLLCKLGTTTTTLQISVSVSRRKKQVRGRWKEAAPFIPGLTKVTTKEKKLPQFYFYF